MINMGGPNGVFGTGGYWSGSGYGPGASASGGGMQGGGWSGGGSLGPNIPNYFSPTGSDYIGRREGSGSPWDPLRNTGFTPASQRYEPGGRRAGLDPEFYYGRAQWQARRRDPQYQQWESYNRIRQLFKGMGINLPQMRPPSIETQWDDVVNGLRNSASTAIGGMPPWSQPFQGFRDF
jgi:hypothetical protein